MILPFEFGFQVVNATKVVYADAIVLIIVIECDVGSWDHRFKCLLAFTHSNF